MDFAFTSLPLFNQIVVISINFISLFLIILLFTHDGVKDWSGKAFVFMAIFLLIWVDFAYMARLVGAGSVELSETLLRIAWIATPLFFLTTFVTAELITGQLTSKKNYSLIFAVSTVSFILSFVTAFTNIIIDGVHFSGSVLDIVYGIGFLPFLLVIFLIMCATLFPLIRSWSDPAVRTFLSGVIIFYIFNAVFNIALPAFLHITHYYYLGDYSTIVLLLFTFYAILRHKLLDIKVFATEIITIIIWSLLISRLFVVATFIGLVIDGVILLVSVIFGVILIRSVQKEIAQKELLRSLTLKLKEIDHKKDEFLNVAAHELRAPMTAIKGYLSMVQNGDGGQVPEKAHEYLNEAITENERLIRLVNNLLNVSRIEENRMVFDLGVVRLTKVVQTVFSQFEHEAKEKGLDYTFEKPLTSIHDSVYVDKDRIHEIVANLISNAVKYTDSGSIKVTLEQNNEMIRFNITDTGPGLSPEEQVHLFQKFYRAESNIGKKIGTGLGLYIARLLIDRFGGTISLDSEKGKGSTFWFELPIYKKK